MCAFPVSYIRPPQIELNTTPTATTGKMTSLSAKDKNTVKAFWAKVAGKEEQIGCDAVSR